MAEPFRTFDENFQALTTERLYDDSGGPAPALGGPGQGGGLASATGEPLEGDTGPSQPQRLQGSTTGGAGDYFEDINPEIEKGRGQLAGGRERFQEAAGPERSYEGIRGEETLRGAVEQGQGTDEAKALAGARYEGPSGFLQEDLDALARHSENLRQYAGALQGGVRGTEALVGSKAQGLNPGLLRYEASRLERDPEYQARKRASGEDISGFMGELGQGEREVGEFAGRRRTQEEDIAKRSMDYLTGYRGDIEGAIDPRVQAEEARRQQLLDEYGQFKEAGSLEELYDLQSGVRGGVDLSGFNTAGRQAVESAAVDRDAIFNAYQDIADVPMLQPGINSHGRERWELPDEYWNELVRTKGMEEAKKIRTRAQERHKALVEKGFSSRSENYLTPEAQWVAEEGRHGTLRGDVAGVTFGDPMDIYRPEDIRGFVGFQEGTNINREALATAQERERFNRIQEILGLSTMVEPQEAFRRAEIEADLAGYERREKEEIGRRKGTRDKLEQLYAESVGEARHGYKQKEKAKRHKKIGQILGGIGGLLTPAPWLFAPVGAYVGGEIGESLA